MEKGWREKRSGVRRRKKDGWAKGKRGRERMMVIGKEVEKKG